MLYVFYHNLRAQGAVHVVNLLKLNHTQSFILLLSLAHIQKPWAMYPLLHTEYSHPEQ